MPLSSRCSKKSGSLSMNMNLMINSVEAKSSALSYDVIISHGWHPTPLGTCRTHDLAQGSRRSMQFRQLPCCSLSRFVRSEYRFSLVPDLAIGLPFRKQDGKCNGCQQVLGDVNSIKVPFGRMHWTSNDSIYACTLFKPLPIPPRYRVSHQNRQSL